jgi:hypothetical protein
MQTDDIDAWLSAIWDEGERIALDAAGWDRSGHKRASGHWVRTGISSLEDDERRSVIYSDNGQVSGAVADHAAQHDPASVLARIAADRQILALGNCGACEIEMQPCDHREDTLRLLALPYADRPGYQESWRPAQLP